MVSKEESRQRIARLQAELMKQGIDGALILYPIDVYYYAGTRQNSALWIPSEGEPLLLVRKSFTRAREESTVADIRPFPSSKEFSDLFPEPIRKIGVTFDVLPVQQFNFYVKLLPGREVVDISGINRELRSVKSPWELDQMYGSASRLCGVFQRVPEFLKAGSREIDLAADFEWHLRRAGSEGYVRMRAFNQELFQGLAVSAASAGEPGFFDGAVTGRGLSSASPHGPSTATIEAGSPVLIDYTAVYNGYIVDMTRVFAVGQLDPELRRAFDVALSIQGWLVENLRPGAVCEELFFKAAAMAEEAGLGHHFMGVPGENARFVGHGVGLELDEFPVLAQGFKMPLQAGQTIAVEPKFVFPGRGVVGIENTFAVGEGGGVKITDLEDAIVFL